VVLVEPGIATVMRELNLELHLVGPHRQIADRAWSADPRPTPCTVRAALGHFALLDGGADFRAESLFIHEAMLGAPTRIRD